MVNRTSRPADMPRIDRPAIPAAYGVTKASEFVDWSHVEDRLNSDRVYWLATVGPGGRPRVRPVDGIYVDGAIYVGGSPETQWVRDLAKHAHVSVHLDGVDDVVIIEGEADVMTGMEDRLAEQLAAASNAKFAGIQAGAGGLQETGSDCDPAAESRDVVRYHPEPDAFPFRRRLI